MTVEVKIRAKKRRLPLVWRRHCDTIASVAWLRFGWTELSVRPCLAQLAPDGRRRARVAAGHLECDGVVIGVGANGVTRGSWAHQHTCTCRVDLVRTYCAAVAS